MVRGEAKNSEEQFGIAHRGRLLQIDQTIHHGKIRIRKPRTPILKLTVKRGPSRGDRLQQAQTFIMQSASVTKINSHPASRIQLYGITKANVARRSFILRLPGEHIVVT